MLSASLNKTFPSFLPLGTRIACLYRKQVFRLKVLILPAFLSPQIQLVSDKGVRLLPAMSSHSVVERDTFYLRLYGVRHMVKDHSDSEKGNPLPPHRLLLLINSKGSFICTIPQTG